MIGHNPRYGNLEKPEQYTAGNRTPLCLDSRTTMPEEFIPIFRVKDGLKAAEWYSRLGFEVESEHRFAPGMPLYLFLRRGNVRLHLSEHKGDARPGTLVYFYVHDLDAIAKEFNADVLQQPWGREVKISDPDGNRLRIGERKE